MSTKLPRRHGPILTWLVLFLGLCLLVALAFVIMPHAPTQYPDYLTTSPSPTGVKAFYTLLRKDITQVAIWQKPVQALPQNNSSQLMIMVEPSTPLNPNELAQWTEWMEAGNRLWLVMSDPQNLFNLNTLPLPPSGQKPQPETLTGLADWQGTYHATVQSVVRLKPQAQDQILLKDRQGVVALARGFGKGELLVLLAPEWLTNGSILKQDNFRLVMPFVTHSKAQVIWFNDYIHGMSDLPAVLGVYPTWFLVLLSQITIALLLWLWYKGKRFGPIRTPREWILRFGDERIRAFAAWYEKGKFYQASLEVQAQFVRQAMQSRWGIPLALEGQEFIAAAGQRMPSDKQHWLRKWQELQEACTSNKISQQSFVKWSQVLNEMQKEVEQR